MFSEMEFEIECDLGWSQIWFCFETMRTLLLWSWTLWLINSVKIPLQEENLSAKDSVKIWIPRYAPLDSFFILSCS